MNNNNNKSNGVRKTAGASTSLYSKEENLSKPQRQSSSALPTFFKWFKKSNHRKSTATNKNPKYFNSGSSAIEYGGHDGDDDINSDRESLSPPSTPQFGHINNNNNTRINNHNNSHLNQLSPSISCDSVLSTSTIGFSFIRPHNYRPADGDVIEPKILLDNNTDSIQRRLKAYDKNPFPSNEQINYQIPKISLTHKYFLYDSDTFASFKSNPNSSFHTNTNTTTTETTAITTTTTTTNNNTNQYSGNYDNVEFLGSPYQASNHTANTQQIESDNKKFVVNRRQRRTFSDSSKDKRSGAYVHVAGKRKAPDPPLDNNTNTKNRTTAGENRLYRTLTPVSTLVRKKRRAPQPPPSPFKSPPNYSLNPPADLSVSILADGLLDDKDIKAIIDGTANHRSSSAEMSSSQSNDTISTSSINTPRQSVPNGSSTSNNSLDQVTTISPRPWYKRSIPMNRDSVIPFKREIVLRTMEKRKNKQKSQPILPEVSYIRSSNSIFDTGSKFGFFSRNKETNDNTRTKDNYKEKRQSVIGMPNISELDRETTEIINKEKADKKNQQFYKPSEHLILQQQMFEAHKAAKIEQDQQQQNLSEVEETTKSAKELITKFELSSSTTKTTLNTSFIGRTEHFIDAKDIQNKKNEENIKLVKEVVKLSPIYNNNIKKTTDESINKSEIHETNNPLPTNNLKHFDPNDTLGFTKMTWTCPLCTLENPNWRIICEVCEKLKPYDQIGNQMKVEKLESPKVAKKVLEIGVDDIREMDKKITQPTIDAGTDWDKKAEQVKKYFMSHNSQMSPPSNKKKLFTKSQSPSSPSKLPVSSSPKLGRSSVQSTDNPHEIKPKNGAELMTIAQNDSQDNEFVNIKKLEQKEPLLDSLEVITTTVTPVFYAVSEKTKNNYIDKKINENDINLEEMRNARLAKFTQLSIPEESKLNDHDFDKKIDAQLLELEKQRLRDKIRAMNAKALAEKYPINRKSLISDDSSNIPPSVVVQQPIPPKRTNASDKKQIRKIEQQEICNSSANANKLGAIKKVFNKNSSKYDKNKSDSQQYIADNKPKKVSTSAQTAGFVKKQLVSDLQYFKTYENLNDDNKQKDNNNEAIYSNVPPTYENQSFGPIDFTNKSNSKIQEEYHETSQKLQKIDDKLNHQNSKDIKENSNMDTNTNDINRIYNNNNNINSKASKGINRTDTLVLNKITKNLEVAILNGKHEMAAKLAMDLARMKVSLQVTKIKTNPDEKRTEKIYDQKQKTNQSIIIDMFVEDQISRKGPIQISVRPSMTLRELKIQAFIDYNIPMTLQRWLLNKKLLIHENRTLMELGIQEESASTLYLFILKSDLNTKLNFKVRESPNLQTQEILEVTNKSTTNLKNNSLTDKNGDGAKALDFTRIGNNPNPNKTTKELPSTSWQCSFCTLINGENALMCSACCQQKPSISSPSVTGISVELKKFLEGGTCVDNTKNTIETKSVANLQIDNSLRVRPLEQRNDLNKKSLNRKSTDIYNITEEIKQTSPVNVAVTDHVNVKPIPEVTEKPAPVESTKITTKKVLVPNITKPFIVAEVRKISPPKISTPIILTPNISKSQIIDVNTRNTAQPLNFSSPNITKSKYRGVDNFNPYRKDYAAAVEQAPSDIKNVTVIAKETSNQATTSTSGASNSDLQKSAYTFYHYMEILKLDTTDIVKNMEPFECPICFTKIISGSGAVLRDCLHTFCKECLANTIQYTDDVEIKCPYANPEYSCTSVLQEREIRALVTKDLYEKHLAKSVQFAEYQSENAFHCKTPNCRGWCIYEDNVNQFKCPVCKINNCLTCRVIHDGLTCKQYQDRLNSDCDSNSDARRTKEMLQEMVATGEAMNCPTCQVIMMKKWGCDWLKCSMCKTEVCWVTRGPRWGPAGKGDTTAGCKCGVNGVKCHPKCNYCH